MAVRNGGYEDPVLPLEAIVTSGPTLPPGHVLILDTIAAGDCTDI